MDPSVRTGNGLSREVGVTAGTICDPPSRLLDEENACRNVPGVESQFPKTFVATVRHIAQVESGRTASSESATHLADSGPVGKVAISGCSLPVRKTTREQ